MSRDRSLDEFANAGDASGDAGGSDSDAEDPARGDPDRDDATGSHDADAVTPPTATYRWDPDGVVCPDCGRTVEERWRHESRHVCADCVEW